MAEDDSLTVLFICPVNMVPPLACSVNDKILKIRTPGDLRQVHVKFITSVDELLPAGTLTDFVVLVVDGKAANIAWWCRRQLSELAQNFPNWRTILLNGSCRTSGLEATKELIRVADRYQIPYMNSEIADPNSCQAAAEKILKLALMVCGSETGVPVVIPTVNDFFAE